MVASVFDLFKIGVGPSSSHTMGPMTAAADFARRTTGHSVRVEVRLYGSLALTGKGHCTDRAIILGLAGNLPDSIDPDDADRQLNAIRAKKCLKFGTTNEINFDESRDIIFLQRERLNYHSNGMVFLAFDTRGILIEQRTYYSVGGGTVIDEDQIGGMAPDEASGVIPHNFGSGEALLSIASETGKPIAQLMRENEQTRLSGQDVSAKLLAIHHAMSDCIDRGICTVLTELPGGLNVKRRAPNVYATLLQRQERSLADPLSTMDWINLWALAVNEENAAGGKVVTAPTNGAAGIIPAVLRYYERFLPKADERGIEFFLLTAGAIGSLYKENASISGAEVGCQGEIGVACSMAAAGLAAVMGATPEQIENAAEIGMEHNLGLTCDPVAGLVQVPCIERNAVGAVKAIEAARLAMLGDGFHRVSLDQVIETMRKTGADMSDRYKETSLGGLAVNVVAC